MTKHFLYTVEQIDTMLVQRMPELVRHLAPNGSRVGHEWIAINPARPDHKRGSFSINLNTGVWKDFAAGDGARAMPGLGLVAYLATKGNFRDAIFWAKDWLGLTGKDADPAQAARAEAMMKKSREEEEKRRAAKLNAAYALYLDGVPIGEDPAAKYLASRGIEKHRLPGGAWPRSLKFHRRLTHKDHPGQTFPGIVACQSLEGRSGGFGGVHRIYLAQVNGVWTKAFGGEQAKLSLGYQSGASIRLSAGVSGRKLGDAPQGEWVHVTEGIEDGLSLVVACPELRVVAVYSLAAMGLLCLPPQIGGVTVVADNDAPGSKAEEALENAMLKLADRHAVKIARLPAIFKDVNDALQNKRRAPIVHDRAS